MGHVYPVFMGHSSRRAATSGPNGMLREDGRAGVRLGIGHGLEQIALNPRYRRRLASEAEVLALRPELNQTE